jgi:hypothetical protein
MLVGLQGSESWSSLNSLFLSNVSRQLKSITPPSIADSRLDRKTLSSSPNVGRRSLTLRLLTILRSLRPSTMSSSGEQQQAEAQRQPWTGGEASGGGGESSSSNGTTGDGGGGRGEAGGGGGGGGSGGGRNKAGMQDPHNNGARAALTNEIRSEFFRLYGEFN